MIAFTTTIYLVYLIHLLLCHCHAMIFKIGGVFPLNYDGNQCLASFLMAIQEINNKSDGIFDDLLPNMLIKYSIKRTNGGYFQSVQKAIELTTISFNKSGIDACIGAQTNTESKAIAQIFNAFNTIQISYGSTSSSLSYRDPFPYFFRTCTSDAAQSLAMADIIYNYFGWRKVSIFSSTDSYGSDGIYVFKNEAQLLGLQILSAYQFQSGQQDFSSIINQAKDVGTRIFVLFMSASDASKLLEQGYNLGLFREGTQVIGSGQITSKETWNLMSEDANVAAIMKGYIGILPSMMLNNASGPSFVKRWRSQKSTIMTTTNNNSSICDESTDSDGIPLYSKNSACLGLQFQSFALNGSDISHEAFYTYDATYALAFALHKLLIKKGNIDKIQGDSLGNILLNNLSFTGVTGDISFRSSDPATGYGYGDRSTGLQFNIMNFNTILYTTSNEMIGLQKIGVWSTEHHFQPCYPSQSSCSIEFNTVNNLTPLDIPPPTYEMMVFSTKIAILLLFSICTIFAIGCLLFLAKFKKTHLIRASQIDMLFYYLIGCLVGCFYIFTAILPTTTSVCILRYWLSHVSFWLIFSTLLVKSWRVHSLLISHHKKIPSTKKNTLNIVLVINCFVIIYLILVTILGHPSVNPVAQDKSKLQIMITNECALNSPIFMIILNNFEVCILFLSVYLCSVTKNITNFVQDSGYVATGLIVLVIIAVVDIPLVYFLGISYQEVQIIIVVSYAIGILSTMILIFIPKLLLIKKMLKIMNSRNNNNYNNISIRSSSLESFDRSDMFEILRHSAVRRNRLIIRPSSYGVSYHDGGESLGVLSNHSRSSRRPSPVNYSQLVDNSYETSEHEKDMSIFRRGSKNVSDRYDAMSISSHSSHNRNISINTANNRSMGGSHSFRQISPTSLLHDHSLHGLSKSMHREFRQLKEFSTHGRSRNKKYGNLEYRNNNNNNNSNNTSSGKEATNELKDESTHSLTQTRHGQSGKYSRRNSVTSESNHGQIINQNHSTKEHAVGKKMKIRRIKKLKSHIQELSLLMESCTKKYSQYNDELLYWENREAIDVNESDNTTTSKFRSSNERSVTLSKVYNFGDEAVDNKNIMEKRIEEKDS